MNKRYLDQSLTPEVRASELLEQMTLEEKVGQLMQVTCMKADPVFQEGKAIGWHYSRMGEDERQQWVHEKSVGSFLHALGDEITEIQKAALSTRLGIPVLFGIDAIHGHALKNGATIFPSQLSMSCSWDPESLRAMGRVTASEVAADGIHWTFSPVLCVGRDLRWGRINETFGEDPFLIGELGAAMIEGYQGDDLSEEGSILACAKHYLAYGESTGGRDAYDAPVSHRKLRELFLPPFKRAVEAGCATVMTGYQSIDGTPITISQQWVRHVLKEEIGFDGFVVTDWNNAESLVTQQKVAATLKEAVKMTLLAGNDLFMNTPGAYEALIELVQTKELSEAILNEAVKRVLLIKFRLGLFEKAAKRLNNENSVHMVREDSYFIEKAHTINLDVTRKSIVLLENKNDVLPFNSSVKRVAVIGPNADHLKHQIGDWTYYTHPIPKDEVPLRPYSTVLEGIQDVAKTYETEVLYHKGCDLYTHDLYDVEAVKEHASAADVIVAVIGDGLDQTGEFKDRGDLSLSGGQMALLKVLKSTGKPLVVVLVNGKPLAIPWIKENADAVIEAFNPGMFGGQVIGEILWGETVPSGKLTISFPHHVGQLPVYYNQLPGWHGSKYMDLPMDPLYSFGYGLSYTNFEYTDLTLAKEIYSRVETIEVTVSIKNTGKVDSDEIVQLYVTDVVSSVMTPSKTLKGFKRVHMNAGETLRVTLEVPVHSLSLVNGKEQTVVEPGEFIIWVGPSSREFELLQRRIYVE